MTVDDLLARLDAAADGTELSASISREGTERRVLFFLFKTSAAVDLVEMVADALGMPESAIREWRGCLPEADAIGLALREDGRSIRLYTQYWDRLAAAYEAGQKAPAPLYLGVKALPDRTLRADIYEAVPEAPRGMFWPAIEAAFTGLGLNADELRTAFAPLDAESAIFTRTEGRGRHSWLVTVRRAGLDRSHIARTFAPLTARPELTDLIDGLSRHDLLHVAGGTDLTKGEFVSIYREAAPGEALARLSHLRQAPEN